jgi:hypothetical protein
MKTHVLLISSLTALLVIGGLGWYIYQAKERTSDGAGASVAIEDYATTGADLSDDRRLLGISHYYFVGKIVDEVGTQTEAGVTQHRYVVDVILDIKGSLSGMVTMGANGVRRGSTYLMGARSSLSDWHNISVFAPGRMLITDDGSLSDNQLRTMAEGNERVIALRSAYEHEILDAGDIARHTTWNSYESLRAGKLFAPGSTEVYPTQVRYIDSNAPVEFANDRELVGASHYVFVGKVVTQLEDQEDSGPYAISAFSVDIVGNIKGSLAGTVMVRQQAGYKDGVCVIARIGSSFEYPHGCADALLQVGRTYLILARYDGVGVMTLGVPPLDHQLISADDASDIGSLEAVVQRDDRVNALRSAYSGEVLPEFDVQGHTTYNSYESLQSGHLYTPPPFAPSTAVAPGEAVRAAPTAAPVEESASPATSEEAVKPTPAPTSTPGPTVTPEPSPTPEATIALEPSATPEITATPEPSPTTEPSATPVPTATPGVTPAPTE